MTFSNHHPYLIDKFGRIIDYLRISITDRCDFRCIYCMAEEMTFLPRSQILTLEEIYRLAKIFVELGVKKIRITGGEPLLRNGMIDLLDQIGKLENLKELVLTTNGSHLASNALALKKANVKRLNISLDTLQTEKFRKLTRTGNLSDVLAGIEAAKNAEFTGIKLNAVILKNHNDDEICDLVEFAIQKQIDISFIEEMPLGVIKTHHRGDVYCSSDAIKAELESHFDLLTSAEKTGGPSRYFVIKDTKTKIGFISPHSHNFCSDCNRVRITAEGKLFLCLGNETFVDLKKILRGNETDNLLKQSIVNAIQLKPEKHFFNLLEQPVIFRHMNVTGG